MTSSIHHELSYEKDIETVKKISFGILSPEEIIRTSVAEINKTDTYQNSRPVLNGLFDPRMGVTLGVLDHHDRCRTCNQSPLFCPGHFGHIVLAKPVYHIHFFPIVKKVLRCICYNCSSLLIDEATALQDVSMKWTRSKRWEVMSKKCSKIGTCPSCESVQPEKVIATTVMNKITLSFKKTPDTPAYTKDLTPEDVLYIFKKMKNKDIDLIGLSHKDSRPEWMICTVLPVCPPSVRPSVRMDNGQRSEDDLTHKLCDIIKANTMLKSKNPSMDLTQWTDLLQYHVATLVENKITGTIPFAQQRSGRPLKSIVERLESKDGRIRGNLMGKRVDYSARSVITPDPNISIDELGVPLAIAMNLTFPEIVNKGNISTLQQYVMDGPDKYPGAKFIQQGKFTRTLRTMSEEKRKEIKLSPGDIVHRHMLDGDVVLFNRQPSLHKYSMMCHRVRVMPDKTFRLNVCVCLPYNSDFDGDEMNLHLPQSLASKFEIQQLAAVTRLIVGTKDCKPLIGVVQDVALGVYRLTKPDVIVPKRQVFNLLGALELTPEEVRKAMCSLKDDLTGKELFSSILPRLVNYGKEGSSAPYIKDGVLLSGTVTKQLYQGRTYGLVHSIFNDLGPQATRKFFDNTQRLVCNWLAVSGFSVGLSDMQVSDDIKHQIQGIVEKQFEKVSEYQAKFRSIDSVQSRNHDITYDTDSFERDVNSALNSVVAEVQAVLSDGVRKKGNNRILDMIDAGSKGSLINMVQMMGCVGQQNVDGMRIPYGFDGRTLPHYLKYDDGPESRGFVRNSFARGLTPQEFFFHAMGGREGLIDTAVRTADIGYAQRKLVKAMEDLKVSHDFSVRNASGSIVQFLYGEDGMEGSKIESHKLPTLPIVMVKLCEISKTTPKNDESTTVYDMYRVEDMDNLSDFKDCMNPETYVKLMKDQWGETEKQRFKAHLYNVLESDTSFVAEMFSDKPAQQPELLYPVSFERSLTLIKSLLGIKADSQIKGDLTPVDVLDAIDELCCSLNVTDFTKDKKKLRHVFGILTRCFLSPKYLMIHRGINTKQALNKLMVHIKCKFREAIIQPSEMVGVIAAQSIGEPATQLTLNTFHNSGIASASKAVRGVPRLKELLSATKNMKSPSMIIRGISTCKRHLQALYLKDLVEKSIVFYDITKSNGRFANNYRDIFDTDLMEAILTPDEFFKSSTGGRSRTRNKTKVYDTFTAEEERGQWRVYLKINKFKLAARYLTLHHIKFSIENYYRTENVAVRISDENDVSRLLIEVRLRGALKPEEDQYLHMKAFESSMLENVLVHGISSLIKVSLLSEDPNGDMIFDTNGSNLVTVLARHREQDENLNEEDHVVYGHKTVTNDVYEILKVLGVEAARQALLNEIIAVIESASTTINKRHLTLLVDTMTSRGGLMPVDRHGINRVDIGPLAKASFEETKDMLVHAGVFAESDPITGVSANIMLGQLPPSGTGDTDILIDEEYLPKDRSIQESTISTCRKNKRTSFEFTWSFETLVESLSWCIG